MVQRDSTSDGYMELSAADVESLLSDLVAAYRSDEFQRDLATLIAECSKSGIHPLLKMAPVCLKVQAPILERFGQPPNAIGVDIMKHSVERRVAEGNHKVEALANEARAILGLGAMPDRSLSAEHVLAAKAAETNARLGLAAGQSKETELEAMCLERILACEASGAISHPSAACLKDMLSKGQHSVPAVLALQKVAKLGHTVSTLIGNTSPTGVAILEKPSAEQFFRNQVLPNRPAVLRGLFNMDNFPPMRDFPNSDYMRSRCGDRRVVVKSLAHHDKEGRPIFVSDPELKLSLKAFLDSLEEHEEQGQEHQNQKQQGSESRSNRDRALPFYLGKVPLGKELPELVEDIAAASTDPQRLFGSCFGDLVPQGIFTYYGCGRNTTAVHFDAHENLCLCVCGSKRFWLYPPSDARYLYPCNDFSRSAVVPFAQPEAYSQELQSAFPLTSQARPLEVVVNPGELLYLPSCWWHCVEGSAKRNMILNWWFCLHADKVALANEEPTAQSC
mmetsp:Transcript_1801/g.4063  ORF Transcript_1801/g.4063 Transcript_1801/m.4063 type:complete len:504 (+) Transcript_1801:58-1569(+)